LRVSGLTLLPGGGFKACVTVVRLTPAASATARRPLIFTDLFTIKQPADKLEYSYNYTTGDNKNQSLK
jgi:hypothetical protein